MDDAKKTTDLDFMSDIAAATRLQPSWQSNILLYTICALFAFIIAWANIAELEIITRGSGKVVPTSEIQLVQSLEGGILAELNIDEGDRVEKGQILARIENVAFASEERGIEAQSLALTLKQLRLQAESQEQSFNIPSDLLSQNKALADNELSLYQSRQEGLKKSLAIADENIKKNEANLRELNATLKRLSDSKRLLSEQLKITRGLVTKKAMPKLEALKQERELSDISGELNAASARKKAISADIAASKNTRDELKSKFKSDALTQLSEAETQLSALKESLTAAEDRVDRTELRAPVAGVVKTISQKTIGGVVDPAMKLIEIVPLDDDLKITAQILPADIAFLKIDQDVNVKITAYDSSKFGSLRGKLKRISADTIEDKEGNIFFEIDVITDKNYLGSTDTPLPIIPGMEAETEVITGKRTVMYYLAKPFMRARDRAMTEQ